VSCDIILHRFLKVVFKVRMLNILHIWRKDFNCFFFTIPNLYAGMRSARAMRKYEKWDSYSGAMGFARTIRRRRCSRLCPRKRDTRHSPALWLRRMLSGCIVQWFSLPFVHGRLANRGRHPWKTRFYLLRTA